MSFEVKSYSGSFWPPNPQKEPRPPFRFCGLRTCRAFRPASATGMTGLKPWRVRLRVRLAITFRFLQNDPGSCKANARRREAAGMALLNLSHPLVIGNGFELRPICPAIFRFSIFGPLPPRFSTEFPNHIGRFWPPAESSAAYGINVRSLPPLHASHASQFFLKDSLSDSKSEDYFIKTFHGALPKGESLRGCRHGHEIFLIRA